MRLLLDTMSLFFRAHHALPPMSTSAGEPTSAIYGFSVLLLKLLREHPGAELAFALDPPGGTFRHELYAAYKAGRPPTPDALKPQFGRLHALIEALGVPAHVAPGFEADDVLATLAAVGTPARVVTGDRDLFQVADPPMDVLFVGRRGGEPVVVDRDAVIARFGVEPRQLPSYVALVGDPSDNLEGVAGVGPKTAARWVSAHGDVAGILTAAHTLEPARLRAAISAAAARLRMNERLARLRTDAPIDATESGRISPHALTRLQPLFAALEFRSLLPRLAALAARDDQPDE